MPEHWNQIQFLGDSIAEAEKGLFHDIRLMLKYRRDQTYQSGPASSNLND
jgi:hypothetical protein